MENQRRPQPTPPRPMRPQPRQGPPRPKSLPTQKRKVFLNFRGDDLPIAFMESLMLKLGKEEISIFIERDELSGRETQHRFTRIKKSNVALAIFSERYAESEWCLDELVEMNEHVEQNNLKVIPVYYKVSKMQVRKPEGEFGNHFSVTRKRHENDQEKILRWENALKSIARDGITFEGNGNTSELVDDIIGKVKSKLNMTTYWPTQYVFLATLAIFVAMAYMGFPAGVKHSAEWVVGFPVFVAMAWQIICHG